MHIIHHFQQLKHEYVHGCVQKKLFCICVCVCAWACMYLKVCTHSNSLSLGYLTLRSWHTFPASTGWICFCPLAGPLPHFLSRKGGSYSRRMCLFIKTGAVWIFQTGNMIPQCHPTQRRGLWVSSGVERAGVKPQIGTWLPGTTCSQWQTLELMLWERFG